MKRGFTFNIMPSEVVSKAEVSKSTQANEIEGGIGGVVNLVTNRPLDFKPKGDDLYISGTARGTYNDLSEDDVPLVGHMLLTAKSLAEREGIAESGYRLILNCNRDGGQVVYHLHMHLLGGRPVGPMVVRK